MNSIGIFGAPGKPQALPLANHLAELASRRGLDVRMQVEHAPPSSLGGDGCPISEELASADVLVTLSGDGGVLAAVRAATKFNTPVLAVDLGRLGFLSAVRPDEIESSFERLMNGEFEVEERMLIDSGVMRRADGAEPMCIGGGLALNDAVVAKSALARILRLSIFVSGELVAAIRADGLVVSTPTGSTAYALSAGGPIVPPDVPLLLIAPICAHTLNQRPFIVGPDELLEVRAEWEGDEVTPDTLDAMLTIDGQVGVTLRPGDVVRVRRAPEVARLLRDPRDSFYARLRHKMGWGG
jgi:NAD+ kinase